MKKVRWGFLFKVLGVWVGVGDWFGNCLCPAIVLCIKGMPRSYMLKDGRKATPAWVSLTLRSRGGETTIYMHRLYKWWWNSEHIARRFGRVRECETHMWCEYQGLFGSHSAL